MYKYSVEEYEWPNHEFGVPWNLLQPLAFVQLSMDSG